MRGKEIRYGKGIYFTDDGQVKSVKCHIVYGPPAGGKTTYVKEHMRDGDLVVDLDYIKQAISMKGKLEAPENILPIALSVREHIYELAAERKIDCENVWIVAGLPRKNERTFLQERLKADLIFMDTDYEECIRRAELDSERKDKAKARAVVAKWFANYES